RRADRALRNLLARSPVGLVAPERERERAGVGRPQVLAPDRRVREVLVELPRAVVALDLADPGQERAAVELARPGAGEPAPAVLAGLDRQVRRVDPVDRRDERG